MKLMMNGAVTVGTLDGANVEIAEAVGEDNVYIFGMNTKEVDDLWRNGYNAREFYYNSPVLKGVIDRFGEPIGNQSFSHIIDYLIGSSHGVSDPYMCLADFDSYLHVYKTAVSDYSNKLDFAKKSLINTARSGVFAADNSITKYASEIWHAQPVNKTVGKGHK